MKSGIQIVTMNGSDTFEASLDEAEVIKIIEARGFKHTGYEQRSVLRHELRGMPKFEGLCGPMYGGEGYARYETWKAYDFYSR